MIKQWIYVGGSVDGTEFKIGMTTQTVPKRMRDLRRGTWIDSDLRFLGAVRTDARDSAVHDSLAAFNIDRERFYARGLIRDWVRWLLRQPFVALTEDEASDIEFTYYSDFTFADSTHSMAAIAPQHQSGQLFYEPVSDDPWADVLPPPELQLPHESWWASVEIIEACRSAMGTIDLDVASSVRANRRVRATTIYTPREDGLAQPWCGNVFVHPDWPEWRQWAPKAVAEVERGEVAQLCAIFGANQITGKGVKPLIALCSGLAIVEGRPPFDGPDGGFRTRSPQGYVVGYCGTDSARFVKAFEPLGTARQLHEGW